MMVPKMILLLKKGLLAVATVTAVAMAMIGHPAHARDYIIRDHLVIDLRFGVEWLRCSVGQVWDCEACHGDIRELNHDEIKQAITMADEQLGGKWRLPSRKELEALVCEACPGVKIDTKVFPNTDNAPYWTGEVNAYAKRHVWSVNFFTGHTYGRFFPNQRLAVRLVRDRTKALSN